MRATNILLPLLLSLLIFFASLSNGGRLMPLPDTLAENVSTNEPELTTLIDQSAEIYTENANHIRQDVGESILQDLDEFLLDGTPQALRTDLNRGGPPAAEAFRSWLRSQEGQRYHADLESVILTRWKENRRDAIWAANRLRRARTGQGASSSNSAPGPSA